jgi:hypothetical protein
MSEGWEFSESKDQLIKMILATDDAPKFTNLAFICINIKAPTQQVFFPLPDG